MSKLILKGSVYGDRPFGVLIMKKIIFFLTVSLLLFFIVSCNSRKQEKETYKDKTELYRSALTKGDSVMIIQTVRNFMDNLVMGNTADALIALYKLDSKKPYKEPYLLNNEELEEVAGVFRNVKVYSYKIDSISYVSAVNNYVKCSVQINKPSETVNPVYVNWIFNPVNYLGEWRLCLYNDLHK